jgi:transcription termination/antitermination protein NusA
VSKEILEGVKLVEKEKGIEPGTLLAAIEDALLAAYRKMPDARHPVRVDLDRDTGDFTAWSVTDDAWTAYLDAHPHHHVLAEAPVVDPDPAVAAAEEVAEEPEPEIEWDWFSDGVLVDVTPDNFSRIAGQTAKQVLRQRINEAERSMMYDEYADRVGEIVTGIVQQDDHRYAFVDLGRMEAILPGSEKVPGERYEQGSRIKAVIIEVRAEGKGPQVVLSRRSDELIRQLFELEVPEIADGLVNIRAVAREPGYRAKIAVESRVQGVDPVGACVGPRGSRVRMVVSELRGEKIDIIPWNDEPARFVAKALAPAKVREVYVDDEARQATVVVPDGELSLAIGKEGLNARLAHRLTGWRIDIVSETEYYTEDSDQPYTGAEGEEDDFPGRCIAVTSSGKRCPNQALEGSRYCGVPAHVALAAAEEGTAASRGAPRCGSAPAAAGAGRSPSWCG